MLGLVYGGSLHKAVLLVKQMRKITKFLRLTLISLEAVKKFGRRERHRSGYKCKRGAEQSPSSIVFEQKAAAWLKLYSHTG
jgi:hypothetical protein